MLALDHREVKMARMTTFAPTLAPDEVRFVAELQEGRAEAFEHLVRGYGGRMLAVARRLLHHEEDAQDAVQEAFVNAFRSIGTFDGRSQIGTWLHRIVVNAALMKLRRKARKPERSIEELLPTWLPDGHREAPGPAWAESGESMLARRETRELVRQSIEQLPETYRTVLVLRDIEELDTEETARLLEVTSAVVKTRLHRARQALRTLLDPHFGGAS